MTEFSANPDTKPLEEDINFKDFLAYLKLKQAAGDFNEKRAVEILKLSSEYLKLIIINFQFINAGGLLAVPSLSSSLLGFSNISRREKLFYLGIPMTSFTLGLTLASICSFSIYVNFRNSVSYYEQLKRKSEFDIDLLDPKLDNRLREMALAGIADAKTSSIRYNNVVAKSRRIAAICGWLSLSCFVFSCFFLGIYIK